MSRASRRNYKQAALDLEANEKLYKDGLVSEIHAEAVSEAPAEELKNRLEIAQQRLEMHDRRHQVAARAAGSGRQSEARRLRAALRQLDDLKVKAGMTGVLQLVPVERGQQVGAGHQPGARGRTRPT